MTRCTWLHPVLLQFKSNIKFVRFWGEIGYWRRGSLLQTEDGFLQTNCGLEIDRFLFAQDKRQPPAQNKQLTDDTQRCISSQKLLYIWWSERISKYATAQTACTTWAVLREIAISWKNGVSGIPRTTPIDLQAFFQPHVHAGTRTLERQSNQYRPVRKKAVVSYKKSVWMFTWNAMNHNCFIYEIVPTTCTRSYMHIAHLSDNRRSISSVEHRFWAVASIKIMSMQVSRCQSRANRNRAS